LNRINKSKNKRVSRPRKTAKATRPAKHRMIKRPRTGQDVDLARYEAALCDPFSETAVGARVPDMYSAPTATYHSRGTITISANASGVASLLLTANPLYSTVDMTSGTVTSSTQNVVGLSTGIYSAATQGVLAGQLSTCRVVGCGYRIKNLIPPATATGRVIMCTSPIAGDAPGWIGAVGTGVSTSSMCLRLSGVLVGTMGATAVTGLPSSILSCTESEECTVQDIIATAVQVCLKPTAPSAFEFHQTSTSVVVLGTITSGSTSMDTAAGALLANDNLNVVNYQGWECLMLRIEGLPVSTIVGEIEYVFHFEGTPQIASPGLGAMYPDAPPKSHININGHNATLSKALSIPAFRIIEDLMNGDLFSAGVKGASMLAGKKRSRKAGATLQNLLAKLGLST